MSGGLLLATRLGEMSYVGYEEYKERVSVDKRAAKGVLAATIQLNDDVTICVTTTHMQAGFPKGWSVEDQINLKTAQFHQARQFINRFVADHDVRDIFFLGDFNDSRFKQLNGKSLDAVILNPDYDAMIDGFLRPTLYQNGFKDLTVPNVDDTFKTYLKREVEFDPIESNEERGIPKGTCFNTAASSYQYFIELVAFKVADATDLSAKRATKMVKKRLAGKTLKKSEYTETIDEIIDEVKVGVYKKSAAVDQVGFMEGEDNVFSEVDYDYHATPFVGKTGFLTDHLSLFVTLKPKDL